jgi:hypothetical protein
VVTTLRQQTQRQQKGVFECPNDGMLFSVPENSQSQNVVCIGCRNSYCRLCLKKQHRGPCTTRKEMIKVMKEADPNMEIMPCPYCLQLSSKDDHCDHVKCYVCKNDFCFRCAAKRQPTLSHGNHFHRPECKHYSAYDGHDDKKMSDCDECTRLGKLCKPPGKLEEGDIPSAELPILGAS